MKRTKQESPGPARYTVAIHRSPEGYTTSAYVVDSSDGMVVAEAVGCDARWTVSAIADALNVTPIPDRPESEPF